MKRVDVLVVGAGPVGLQMALSLLREGFSVHIIDKKAGRTTSSNAVGVNSRTMEIWRTMGFLDEAIKRGKKVHATSLYSGTELLNSVHFDIIKSDLNFMLALPQADSEQLLIEQLEKHNHFVEWNTELVGITQDATTVTADCKANNSDFQIIANWVVGCDGYHSSVRELSGMTRACYDLPLHFLMVDAEVSGEVNTETVNIIFNNLGMIFMIPMKDNIRVVVEISNDPEYKHIKKCEPEVFREIIAKRYPTMQIGRIDWSSAFYIHECLADDYRNERIFIAGDAAHTHSPMGGQGMNTGIQDTWNLAWKLGQVARNEAHDELLDTYSLERRAVGHDVLERSGKLTTVATTNNFMFKFLRNFGIHHFADFDLVRSKLANGISQANICYEDSPLVNHEQIVKSEHLRYSSLQNGWTLLTTDHNLERGDLPHWLKIDFVEKIDLDSKFVLIRPDGYTALFADHLIDIFKYFELNAFKLA